MLSAFLLFTQLAHAAAPLTVIVDAGHGGHDHGTVRSGVMESDITLAVSRELHALLKKDKRFQVSLTREGDASVTLSRRARMAKEKKADIFLSIHVNSSPDPRARGAEFYFQNQLPPDEESMFLAHQEQANESGESDKDGPLTYDFIDRTKYPTEIAAIATDLLDSDRVLRSSELSKTLKLSWKGSRKSKSNSVRQAPFYVLNQMRMPSSLVELGFLTNTEDFQELTDVNAQKRMAADLHRGLVAYKESIDKSLQSP